MTGTPQGIIIQCHIVCPNGEGLYEVQEIMGEVLYKCKIYLTIVTNPQKATQIRPRQEENLLEDISISHGPEDRKYS